jgi:hypothetical protein
MNDLGKMHAMESVKTVFERPCSSIFVNFRAGLKDFQPISRVVVENYLPVVL